jgi:RimJ/RimL family protein N-acetyltransferase
MNTGVFEIPTELLNDKVRLTLLREDDFEKLYKVASDPMIWEQHPNPTRYQRNVFAKYFEGAIASGSAYLVSDAENGNIIGCSRFYDYNGENSEVCIGYTFLSRACWGKHFNRSLKTLMLDHAFRFVNSVVFHVGENNMRSRKAMEKLGGLETGRAEMSYYGEKPHINVIYTISRTSWQSGNV